MEGQIGDHNYFPELGCFREFFVFEVVRLQHLDERIAEEVLILAIVEAPGHLIQVGRKMFHRDLMPRTHNTAFEERESRLDCICGHGQTAFVSNIFIFRVIHPLMLRIVESRGGEIVELRFVGHNHVNGLVHVSRNDLVDLVLVQVRGRDEVEMPLALTDANDGLVLLPLVSVGRMTTDIHFVNFYCALEFMVRLFHRFADAVTQIPCRLIAHTQRALELIRRHALAALAEQIRAKKPFPQVQMRVVENRRCGDRKLVMA